MHRAVSVHLGIRVQDSGLAANHQVLGTSFADPLQVIVIVLHASVPVLALTRVPQ